MPFRYVTAQVQAAEGFCAEWQALMRLGFYGVGQVDGVSH